MKYRGHDVVELIILVLLLPVFLLVFVYEMGMRWKRDRDAERAWQEKLDSGR
jgi:hypothetical protein